MLSSIRGRSADSEALNNHSPPINSTGPSGAVHWGEAAVCMCVFQQCVYLCVVCGCLCPVLGKDNVGSE